MLPYGGYNMSGIGHENGQHAIDDYAATRTMVEPSGAEPHDRLAD
jgi:acyl-CoA reductase-like NAD-dependent aldehyde dehydrogenase